MRKQQTQQTQQATQLCGDGNWSSFGRRMVLPYLKESNGS